MVSRSILIPAAKNMKYLKLKLQFLSQKKEEAVLQGQAASANKGVNPMNSI
jgi:hypothetical protein